MAADPQPKHHHRTGRAVVPPERVPWRREHRHKELMFFAGVGLSVLVILGLYAASFHYQPTFQDLFHSSAAWQNTQNSFLKQTGTIQKGIDQLNQVRDSISAALNAKATQDRGIQLLKNTIRSASTTASATATR